MEEWQRRTIELKCWRILFLFSDTLQHSLHGLYNEILALFSSSVRYIGFGFLQFECPSWSNQQQFPTQWRRLIWHVFKVSGMIKNTFIDWKGHITYQSTNRFFLEHWSILNIGNPHWIELPIVKAAWPFIICLKYSCVFKHWDKHMLYLYKPTKS